jgi:hypothetical protein
MSDLKLESREGLLLQSDGVKQVGRKGSIAGQLFLTNLHVIYVSKSFFGKTKGVDKYPIRDIKVVKDQPQVFLTKSPSAGTLRLAIHFRDREEAFEFESFAKRQIEKWISRLRLVIGGDQDQSFENTGAIGGSEILGGMIRETVDMVRESLGMEKQAEMEPERVTGSCKSCMAPLSGFKDKMVRCPYCNTEQRL